MNTAKTHKRLEVETGVCAASPQKLIIMLYDGAVTSLLSAKAALAKGDVAGSGAAVSKAISIIQQGLRPALDSDPEGEIVQNLRALYDYLVNRLLLANLKGDAASLDEAMALLSDLKGAWEVLERRTRREQGARGELAEPLVGPHLTYGRA